MQPVSTDEAGTIYQQFIEKARMAEPITANLSVPCSMEFREWAKLSQLNVPRHLRSFSIKVFQHGIGKSQFKAGLDTIHALIEEGYMNHGQVKGGGGVGYSWGEVSMESMGRDDLPFLPKSDEVGFSWSNAPISPSYYVGASDPVVDGSSSQVVEPSRPWAEVGTQIFNFRRSLYLHEKEPQEDMQRFCQKLGVDCVISEVISQGPRKGSCRLYFRGGPFLGYRAEVYRHLSVSEGFVYEPPIQCLVSQHDMAELYGPILEIAQDESSNYNYAATTMSMSFGYVNYDGSNVRVLCVYAVEKLPRDATLYSVRMEPYLNGMDDVIAFVSFFEHYDPYEQSNKQFAEVQLASFCHPADWDPDPDVQAMGYISAIPIKGKGIAFAIDLVSGPLPEALSSLFPKSLKEVLPGAIPGYQRGKKPKPPKKSPRA